MKYLSHLVCFLGILYSCNNLLANDNNDDLEETEQEASASLKIKSQTQLCSADYYIKKGLDKEEDRKEQISVSEKKSHFYLLENLKATSRNLLGILKETASKKQRPTY